MNCKICAQPCRPHGRATLLGKYEVAYFQCASCGFVQTEPPYWLGEAYASAISSIDIGVISRATDFGRLTRNLLLAAFDPNARFLDYGGGPGVFVRTMRDQGFDFYLYDKFCENMFARGFEAEIDRPSHYALATAFEVFEHFVDPLAEIEALLRSSRSLLFSTLLLPPGSPPPGQWWYYALEHGQHVSLYTYAALAHVARRFGLRLLTNGRSLHLLTDQPISQRSFDLIFRRKLSALRNLWLARRQRHRSLLEDDFKRGSGLTLVP